MRRILRKIARTRSTAWGHLDAGDPTWSTTWSTPGQQITNNDTAVPQLPTPGTRRAFFSCAVRSVVAAILENAALRRVLLAAGIRPGSTGYRGRPCPLLAAHRLRPAWSGEPPATARDWHKTSFPVGRSKRIPPECHATTPPLSRAARLAGVTRSELQKKLRDNDIETFEGKLTVSNLLAIYPDADLESDPVFERVQQIKADARPKRDYSDGWLPEPEVLMTRLKEINSVLMRTKSSLNYAEQILKETLQRIATPGWTARSGSRLSTSFQWLEHKVSAEMPHHDARAHCSRATPS